MHANKLKGAKQVISQNIDLMPHQKTSIYALPDTGSMPHQRTLCIVLYYRLQYMLNLTN